MKIGWLGLGKLGLPCAVALDHYYDMTIYGYDPALAVIDVLSMRQPHSVIEDGLENLLPENKIVLMGSVDQVVTNTDDLVFVAVPTPHDAKYGGEQPMPEYPRDFDYTNLVAVVQEITQAASEQKKDITIVVISTVLPGTMRRLILPLLNEYVKLIYNPFFIAMGTTIRDFRNPEFVLLGAESWTGASSVMQFYTNVYQHNVPILRLSLEEAELTKVSYNTFISLKIVFANTLMEIAEHVGANVDHVVDALALGTRRIISSAYMRGGMGDGGACFPPGEVVITETGPQPIETIRRGDRVLTEDGTLQPVLKTWEKEYQGDLVNLKIQGLPVTRLTADHRVIARQDLRERYINGRKRTDQFPRTDAAETEAGDLTADHLMIFPKPITLIPLPEHATPEYLELAGWWLAEGHAAFPKTNTGRLSWCLHIDEVAYGERIAELIAQVAQPVTTGRGSNAKITINIRPEHKQRNVIFGNYDLATRIVNDFGRLQHERVLPPWALWSDEKTTALLLEGMLKGDGHISDHGISYSTVSKHLAWGVFLMITRLGFRPELRSIQPRIGADGTHHRHAYEVRVRNRAQARELFQLVNIDAVPRGKHEVHVDEWRSVKSTERETYSGPVHNLWVAGTNTYVTSAGLVKNCHPRDNIAMSYIAKNLNLSVDPFDFVTRAREAQTEWLASQIYREAGNRGLPVVILGKAYKPKSNLVYGSPALLLAYYLTEQGVEFTHHDRYVDGTEPEFAEPAVFVVAALHPHYAELKVPEGSAIIDPHRFVKPQDGVELVQIGGTPKYWPEGHVEGKIDESDRTS